MSNGSPPVSLGPLFAGLADAELRAVAEQMRPRAFGAGEQICAAGESSDRLWLITGGLVHILAGRSDAAAGEVIARQRKGDVVGAQGAITGEPRTATVVAATATSALELDAERFLALAQRFPGILINLIRIQSESLVRANARRVEHQRGESVALLSGPAMAATAARVAAAARSASPRPVVWLDRRLSFAGALTAVDDLTDEHATVLLPGELDPETVAVLLDEVDRVVALAGSAEEAEQLGALARAPNSRGAQVEAVLVGEEALAASRDWPAGAPIRVVRACPRADGAGLPPADGAGMAPADDARLTPADRAGLTPADGAGMGPADAAWLARHLTRTKLGLALGAGGAKGYAHVGALEVLEEAGYVVDYVSGSSIGAIVGAYLALGMDSAEIDATLRGAFDADNVAELFKTSLGGGSTALEAMSRLMRETHRGALLRGHADPAHGHGRRSHRSRSRSAARGAAVGGAAGRHRAGRRVPAPRARRPPPGGRSGARARADRRGVRGRGRRRRLGQPDAAPRRSRPGRSSPSRRPLASADRGAACSTPAGGHGPQPARRRAPVTPTSPTWSSHHASARPTGATSTSPTCSSPRGAGGRRAAARAAGRWHTGRFRKPLNRRRMTLTEQTQFAFEDLKRILVDRVGLPRGRRRWTTAKRRSRTWASTRSPSWRSSSPCSRTTGSGSPTRTPRSIHTRGRGDRLCKPTPRRAGVGDGRAYRQLRRSSRPHWSSCGSG